MALNNEGRAIRLLRLFLRNLGYKDSELIPEYRTSGSGRPVLVDLVVVDGLSGTPLLAFEISLDKASEKKRETLELLQRISRAFEPDAILTYLAKVDPDASTTQIWEFVEPDQPLRLVNTGLPRPNNSGDPGSLEGYGEVPTSSEAKTRRKMGLRYRRSRYATRLRVVSWSFTAALLIGVGLDVAFGPRISMPQVTLLAIAAIAAIAPFANSIHAMGVQLEGFGDNDESVASSPTEMPLE